MKEDENTDAGSNGVMPAEASGGINFPPLFSITLAEDQSESFDFVGLGCHINRFIESFGLIYNK